MNQGITSIIGYLGSVAAATLAAALMSGNAVAETPLDDTKPPFVHSLSRSEVKAALAADRAQITSYASEWSQQQAGTTQLAMSDTTREQVRADYIASREQVRVMTAEHGGSGYFGRMPVATPRATVVAGSLR